MDLEFLSQHKNIIGIDEVGRGPIAGPVCACAVKIDNPKLIKELSQLNVTDSKKLTLKKRKQILNTLKIDVNTLELNKVYQRVFNGHSFQFVLSELDHLAIDQMNILNASLKAMENCAQLLVSKGSLTLIDGNKVFPNAKNTLAIVKGDAKVQAIALASIIAKNFRDEKMCHYAKLYPGYFFEKHAGYPTKIHKQAVAKIGPSPIHRKTFKGVKEFC